MTAPAHRFHTRHDFTPALAESAFRLLAGSAPGGLTPAGLADLARRTASPLGGRSDPSKVLASLAGLGLVSADAGRVRLTALGRDLAGGTGRTSAGFRAAVHALYAWGWLSAGPDAGATPSWSYRQACRLLLAGPAGGLHADDVVRGVVDAAAGFGAGRVSFSRSSVAGVACWLAAQSPPLAASRARRLSRTGETPGPSAVRLALASLCGLGGGRAALGPPEVALLAEALLTPAAALWPALADFLSDSDEFLLAPAARPSVAFRDSADPFLCHLTRAGGHDRP